MASSSTLFRLRRSLQTIVHKKRYLGTTTAASDIRNVAIVAHVDHGKTTLVDTLLSASDDGKSNNDATERMLDSGELEMERGITITSKVTRLNYLDNKVINVVDTPGHADFAGEVDRILGMVDGVCLVVDVKEGPMAQTKYVLSRALNMNLNPITVLNKCDRPEALSRIESGECENEIFDLYVSLGANDDQLDYKTFYASAKSRWVTDCSAVASQLALEQQDKAQYGMHILLDAILNNVPPPTVKNNTTQNNQFAMAAANVGYDQFLGRSITGRISSGCVRINDSVIFVPRSYDSSFSVDTFTKQREPSNISGIFVNKGISRTPLESDFASAGDIVTLTGVPDDIAVGDTLTSKQDPVAEPLDTPPLAPPTLSVEFGSNPLAGSGTISTSARIRDRLQKECDNNVTLKIAVSEVDPEKTIVYARGELQVGILIEQMRRENYEFCVSPPSIVMEERDDGKKYEPYEEVIIDVDTEYSGTVVNALTGARKGLMMEMNDTGDGKSRLIFEIPSRGLLGVASELATATRGSAVINHIFIENREHAGVIGSAEQKGKLIATEKGKATLFALAAVSERGMLFVSPGDEVYPGMIVGENSRAADLDVNCVKAKQATNIRTVNKDEALRVPPPKLLSVEELIGYMNEDEIIDVNPHAIRLRKAEMDAGARARAARTRKKQLEAAQRNKMAKAA